MAEDIPDWEQSHVAASLGPGGNSPFAKTQHVIAQTGQAEASAAASAARAAALQQTTPATVASGKSKATLSGIQAITAGDALRRAKIQQHVDALQDQIQQDEMFQHLADARARVNPWSTSWKGQLLQNMGGSDAIALRDRLKTITADKTMDDLKRMKQAAGGSPLQRITQSEFSLLTSKIAALHQAQKPEDVRAALNDVEQHYRLFRAAAAGIDVDKASPDQLFQLGLGPNPAPPPPPTDPNGKLTAGGAWDDAPLRAGANAVR